VDHNFFAPRRTQQRDNDNNNNNERQQHRERVDDNTNEANVDNSVIGELYPPPIFATNYSLSGGHEGNADDIESALRVNENPYTLANQALLNQRRIVGPDIPPTNLSHSGSSKSKSRRTTAVSTTKKAHPIQKFLVSLLNRIAPVATPINPAVLLQAAPQMNAQALTQIIIGQNIIYDF
jgi:hypothetical protein